MSGPNQLQKLRGDGQNARAQDNVGQVLNPLAKAVGDTPIMGAPPPSWILPSIISTSGYAQAAAPLPVTAYHKDALGYVHGKVSLLTAAGAGPDITAFVIGGGYRPSETLLVLAGDGAGNVWDCTIDASGNFVVVSTLAAGDIATATFDYLAER